MGENLDNIYYVYVHYRGDNGNPFYVGKGKGRRAYDKWSRNRHWNYIVNKHGYSYKIIRENLNENCANTLERIEIARLRNSGFDLCNMTDGGDGVRSARPNSRKKVRCSNGMIFESVNEAARYIGSNASKISAACSGRNNTASGLAWWLDGDEPKEYIDPKSRMGKKKEIYRSDGASFESLKSAAASVSGSSANISKCASGGIESAYGYGWSYQSQPPQPQERYIRAAKSLGKPVLCRETGIAYSTSEEAAVSVRDTFPKSSGWPISRCARGLQSQAYGYTWSYA